MFSRRSVLAQLAAIPLVSTFARNLLAQSNGAAPPKRLIIFMQNNGTKRVNFWPPNTANGANPIPATSTTTLPILNTLFTSDGKTDNGLKPYTNMLYQLTTSGGASAGGNQHDMGFARMFTGASLVSYNGAPWGGAISLDQMVANFWNTSSLTTAVYSSEVEPFPKKGFDHRNSFSYESAHNLHYPIIDPYKAFDSIFKGFMPPSAGTGGMATTQSADYQQRMQTRQSVLNAVYGDVKELQGRLGPDDNRKLDYHLAAISGLESKLQAMAGMTINTAACTGAPMGVLPWFGPGVAASGPAFEVNSEQYNDAQYQYFASLISAAIRCGLTRVASLQFGYGGGKAKFNWLSPANTLNPAAMPIGFNHHDGIAHKDTTDDMSNQPTANYVTWINQYYANTVRKVATDLLHTPEGSGNMLDNTLIIWADELGRGDHQLDRQPILFIGMVKNGITAGGRVIQFNNGTSHTVMGYHALKALNYDFSRPDAAPWNVPNLAFSGF
jgi:hypothetical protein